MKNINGSFLIKYDSDSIRTVPNAKVENTRKFLYFFLYKNIIIVTHIKDRNARGLYCFDFQGEK